MRHLVKGRKLGRTASHRKALLGNLATSLIKSEKKSIRTTLAKAKELRPFIEQLITKAKHAYQRERSGAFPAGHVDVHQRRMVGRVIHEKAVLQELFDVVAPVVAERNGGYTRIIKLGQRRGDGAEEAIIQLVDFAPAQDGAVSASRRKKTARPATKKAAPAVAEVVAEAAPAVVEETVAEVVESVEAPIAEVENEVVNTVEEVAEAAPETPESTNENTEEAAGENTEEAQS